MSVYQKLENAVAEGDLDMVRQLLPLMEPDENMEAQLLARSLYEGNYPIAEYLLQKGFDPDGGLVLTGSDTKDYAFIPFLIKHGATPAGLAAGVANALMGRNMKMLDILLSYQPDLSQDDGRILEYAAELGDPVLFQDLLRRGAVIGNRADNIRDAAFEGGNTEIISIVKDLLAEEYDEEAMYVV